MDAKFTITKETLKDIANTSKLSNFEKNNLRLERIKKLDESGELAECKNRYDVAKLMGFTKNTVGYSWVQRMITTRHLVETVVGVDDNGFKICKYRTQTPRKRKVIKKKRKATNKPVAKTESPVKVEQVAYVPSQIVIVRIDGIEVEITNPTALGLAQFIKELRK